MIACGFPTVALERGASSFATALHFASDMQSFQGDTIIESFVIIIIIISLSLGEYQEIIALLSGNKFVGLRLLTTAV